MDYTVRLDQPKAYNKKVGIKPHIDQRNNEYSWPVNNFLSF